MARLEKEGYKHQGGYLLGNHMNAKQARKLTEAAIIERQDLNAMLDIAHERIRVAASQGLGELRVADFVSEFQGNFWDVMERLYQEGYEHQGGYIKW